MKNLIMFFVLVMVMVFSNYEVSYSQEDDGIFLFLIGNEGNEKAIMYLHIEGERAYGSYYTKNQSIPTIFPSIHEEEGGSEGSGFYGSFDGENLQLSYTDSNGKKGKITGTLSLEGGEIESSAGGTVGASITNITFRGKNNSKNVNLSLANTTVNGASIKGTDWERRFIFNVRTLDNLSYGGRYANIVYLDENIIVFGDYWDDGLSYNNSSDVYSINTGKKIEIKDFISNLNDRNLLALLRKKGSDYNSLSSFHNFMVTPNGITFYSDFLSIHVYSNEEYDMNSGDIYINFTFEELKPFIKRGSPLDYLFN